MEPDPAHSGLHNPYWESRGFADAGLHTNLPQGNGNEYVCLWEGCTTKRTFKRHHDLDRHQKTHHMSAQLYCRVIGCERGVGGNGFRREDKLSEHVRAKHAGGSE